MRILWYYKIFFVKDLQNIFKHKPPILYKPPIIYECTILLHDLNIRLINNMYF